MQETHYLANSTRTSAGRTSAGRTSAGRSGVDDHFFRRYRELLDDEDHAFDELEHAYEDGDRAHFELDLAAWRSAFERRTSFLARHGLAGTPLVL